MGFVGSLSFPQARDPSWHQEEPADPQAAAEVAASHADQAAALA